MGEDRSKHAAVTEGLVKAMAQTLVELEERGVGDYTVVMLVFDRETGEAQIGTQYTESQTLDLISGVHTAMLINRAERECITTTASTAEAC